MKRYQYVSKKILQTFLVIALIGVGKAYSYEDQYAFSDEAKASQFQALISELRCVTCQNQNLAESNSPMAQTMRQEIYEKLSRNDSSQEIKKFLVDRYGEFVLYRPVLSPRTWVLWFSPLLILFIVIFAGARSVFNARKKIKVNEGKS